MIHVLEGNSAVVNRADHDDELVIARLIEDYLLEELRQGLLFV